MHSAFRRGTKLWFKDASSFEMQIEAYLTASQVCDVLKEFYSFLENFLRHQYINHANSRTYESKFTCFPIIYLKKNSDFGSLCLKTYHSRH